MNKPIEILCTRPVEEELVQLAAEANIKLHGLTFIKTEPVDSIELQQEVENAMLLETTVVFTSMNAVEAVNDFVNGDPVQWNIYCIGYTTKELVEKYFGESVIAGTADNAAELAQLIIEDGNTDEVIFFCGDIHRNELPNALHEAGIELTEIIVYETIEIPRKIVKVYDGIIFFSPSAVNSFFALNTIAAHTCIFAIGKTTAETVRLYTENELIISTKPSKEHLIKEAIHRFSE